MTSHIFTTIFQAFLLFVEHPPDFIIVDEAHTCARPRGANKGQQQRYRLLNALAQKPDQQLVLLTSIPHSGQDEEFKSLIGLLDPKFEGYDLKTAKEREGLSRHFIQRRRADIKQYLGEETVFPERRRPTNDTPYKVTDAYRVLLNELIDFIKHGLNEAKKEENSKRRYLYWDLLALMRGVMSSPAAGISMPENLSFYDVIAIFMAVMVTDIILLDVFNSLGMPTSTTVSMVFELLGATFAVALFKIAAPESTLAMGDLLNTDKALSVILGIFLSVAIAFVFGTVVQFLARLIFTFEYKSKLKWKVALFGGVACTAIVYFMLLKGIIGVR